MDRDRACQIMRRAIAGDPDQVVPKLRAYTALGIDAFNLSGYPHVDECDLVAKYVLPNL